MCLWRFSTITIAASIMAPMAMAIPPSDMMLAFMPSTRMARNAMRMPIGEGEDRHQGARACSRKTTVTSATMIDSSTSFPFSVSIACSIRPDRS